SKAFVHTASRAFLLGAIVSGSLSCIALEMAPALLRWMDGNSWSGLVVLMSILLFSPLDFFARLTGFLDLPVSSIWAASLLNGLLGGGTFAVVRLSYEFMNKHFYER